MSARDQAVELLIQVTGRSSEQLEPLVDLLAQVTADEILKRRVDGVLAPAERLEIVESLRDAIVTEGLNDNSLEHLADVLVGVHKPIFHEFAHALRETLGAIGCASEQLDAVVDVLSLPEGEVRTAALRELVRRRG